MYAIKVSDIWELYEGQLLPLSDKEGLWHVPPQWEDSEKESRFQLFRVEIPSIPEGKLILSETIIDVEGRPVLDRVYTDIAFEDLRSTKLSHLAEQRWLAQSGGATIPGIGVVRTDDTSQTKINGAVTLFDKDPTLEAIDFEVQSGVWASIDKETMEIVGIAVGRHVQACFSHARLLSELIMAAETVAELNNIDILEGWPS